MSHVTICGVSLFSSSPPVLGEHKSAFFLFWQIHLASEGCWLSGAAVPAFFYILRASQQHYF
ncbi:hypothetical protein VB695_18560 [Nodularia spumigena UHCC 0060]|uniref:Uncharacterized protein n=1 Tax=Nodularia spumigena UHCC 0060 TaxID=3110300 RepID=A0ABU5UUW2_NODSP|nr:hypothetical protein [Nodularia spumigena UHCC 0060]